MWYKRIILSVLLIFSCVFVTFSQYVRGFPGAWYNENGTIYIVNPHETNECEIGHVSIDYMFKVSQNPEIGIVYALEDTSWLADEVISFQNKNVKVRDVLYAPRALPIDLFGSRYGRKQVIIMPKIGDSLANRFYIENGIDIIKPGITKEYYDLIDKLKNSRLIIFNEITEPSYKFIYKDMLLIDYSERIGESDEILTELYNDNEVILNWESFSNRARYPGNYKIKIHYKRYEIPKFHETHEVIDNLRLRLNQEQSAGIIITLNKGTRVQLLETGNNDLIDGIDANWVKVLTEDGYVGWCFSGYLIPIFNKTTQIY